jgi:GntR family transcriptional repressor for pyruvate dehydrogenase complex
MYWSMTPIQQQVTSAIVAKHLRRSIHLGSYMPGDRLPPERELSTDLRISRVTLGGAIHMLVDEGYLTVKRGAGGGTFVADINVLLDASEAKWAAMRQELDCHLTFWRVNWIACAEAALLGASPFDRRRLREASNHKAGNDLENRHREIGFQIAVAEASGNYLIAQAALDGIDAAFVRLPSSSHSFKGKNTMVLRELIVKAILEGDELNISRHARHYVGAISAYITVRLDQVKPQSTEVKAQSKAKPKSSTVG